jgi:hypothetical protein
LREAAAAHQVSKTDVVVQSLKTILSQVLRPADQRQVAKGPAPSIGIGISDMELLAEIKVGAKVLVINELKRNYFQQLTRSARFWKAAARECILARRSIFRPSGVRVYTRSTGPT